MSAKADEIVSQVREANIVLQEFLDRENIILNVVPQFVLGDDGRLICKTLVQVSYKK